MSIMARPCFDPSIQLLERAMTDHSLAPEERELAALELSLKRTIANEGFPALRSTTGHKFPLVDDIPPGKKGSCNFQIYDASSKGANSDDDKECYISTLLLSSFPWPEGEASTVCVEEKVKDIEDLECRNCAEGFITTWSFFNEHLIRDSIDGQGMVMTGVIHWGPTHDVGSRRVIGDAMWDTDQKRIWFGEGQTKCIDTLAHELMHGVTDSVLIFDDCPYNEASALNESISDCFGEMVLQYSPKVLGRLREGKPGEPLTIAEAGWKVSDSERNFKGPSTKLCPKTMEHYSRNPEDRKEWAEDFMHTMCGIPSHAFWRACDKLKDQYPYSWDRVGKVWYFAVIDLEDEDLKIPLLRANSTFRHFAALTVAAAERHFPNENDIVAKAIREAWFEVGIDNIGTIAEETAWLETQEVKESKTPRV